MYAIGGLLKHAPALCAITNPTTNSYKRLVPGFEAPVNLAYSRRNRSAAIRIPVYTPQPQGRSASSSAARRRRQSVPAFSAMLMAMLDGIQNKINPGEPLDKDIYDLEPEELAGRARDAAARSTRRSTPWSTTTSSCCTATSSPPT